MTRTLHPPGLAVFAWATAAATLGLVVVGGLVTSHGAGLAVPDWPNSYGYNMFFFPISKWVGGIFYEHTHRLVASGVGLLTTILAVWLWLKEERRWLRWLGAIALLAVILQGVLGGLRVTLLKHELGIVHATLAQLFFSGLCVIACAATPAWARLGLAGTPGAVTRGFHRGVVAVTAVILLQLVLGAAMRHQHAGLAIPDFPLAYGQLWPDTDPAAIARYNRLRLEVHAAHEITAGQVWLQMAHRIVAGSIALGVVLVVRAARQTGLGPRPLVRLVWGWAGLIGLQIALGAITIWSNKSADLTTAHVAVGALAMAFGTVLAVTTGRVRRRQSARGSTPAPAPPAQSPRGAASLRTASA